MHSATILVADDDAVARELLAEGLGEAYYRLVVLACEGAQSVDDHDEHVTGAAMGSGFVRAEV